MYKAVIDVESVTPTFMYGALNHPEIRASEIKGLMRWWFRAIMGNFVSLRTLRDIESNHFGSTKKKSRITIRVHLTREKIATFNRVRGGSGLRYLWFSLSLQRNALRKNYHRQLMYYLPGTRFKIELTSPDFTSFELALGSLWALIYLGGIGTRMRRGCGSLAVRDFRSSFKVPFSFKLTETEASGIKRFMENSLTKIFSVFRKSLPDDNILEHGNKSQSINFAVLSNKSANICLIDNRYSSWSHALNDIGNKYSVFRGEVEPTERRYIFGLPVSSEIYKDLRYASPIMFGVIRAVNNSYDNYNDNDYGFFLRVIKFYTSIHPDFESDIESLKEKLDEFDKILENELNGLEINIPKS